MAYRSWVRDVVVELGQVQPHLDPTHLTDGLDGPVRLDAIPWRLLLHKDLAVSKLCVEVVVDCAILVPVELQSRKVEIPKYLSTYTILSPALFTAFLIAFAF